MDPIKKLQEARAIHPNWYKLQVSSKDGNVFYKYILLTDYQALTAKLVMEDSLTSEHISGLLEVLLVYHTDNIRVKFARIKGGPKFDYVDLSHGLMAALQRRQNMAIPDTDYSEITFR